MVNNLSEVTATSRFRFKVIWGLLQSIWPRQLAYDDASKQITFGLLFLQLIIFAVKCSIIIGLTTCNCLSRCLQKRNDSNLIQIWSLLHDFWSNSSYLIHRQPLKSRTIKKQIYSTQQIDFLREKVRLPSLRPLVENRFIHLVTQWS